MPQPVGGERTTAGNTDVGGAPAPLPEAAGSRDTGCLVDAYEAGRLWNRLGWHTQQAYLLSAEDQFHKACRAFDRLSLAVRGCVAPGSREETQSMVRQSKETWMRCCRSPELADKCFYANQDLNDRYPATEDFKSYREEVCERLLRPVLALLGGMRDFILSRLDDRQKKAWVLGVCVDQAVRPPEVYRLMYRPEKYEPPSGQGRRVGLGGRVSRRAEQFEALLANRTVAAGEVRPKWGWTEEVNRRLGELRVRALPVELSRSVLERPGTPAFKEAFDAVDQLIRQKLKNKSHRRAAAAGYGHRGHLGRQDERDKWIYEQADSGIAYKEILKNLKSLIKRNPSWGRVTTEQGVRQAARKYAVHHGLQLPPKRR
jgi:hypothetical protein